MDFAPTAQQDSIRDAVAKICGRFDDAYWLAKDRDGGFPHEFYDAMAQAGWLGICIPEAYGGGGFGYSELGIVLEEMGRGLLCAPFFSTAALAACVAAMVMLEAGIAAGVVAGVLAGVLVLAVAGVVIGAAVNAGSGEKSSVTAARRAGRPRPGADPSPAFFLPFRLRSPQQYV